MKLLNELKNYIILFKHNCLLTIFVWKLNPVPIKSFFFEMQLRINQHAKLRNFDIVSVPVFMIYDEWMLADSNNFHKKYPKLIERFDRLLLERNTNWDFLDANWTAPLIAKLSAPFFIEYPKWTILCGSCTMQALTDPPTRTHEASNKRKLLLNKTFFQEAWISLICDCSVSTSISFSSSSVSSGIVTSVGLTFNSGVHSCF